jgi:RNA polymerase sigma-70 factor (ECF subfamily)
MPSSNLPDVVELTLPGGLALGDPAAIGDIQEDVLRLFDECGPRVCRYVRSFGLPADAAEDVAQEVFLSLFRHLLLGRPRGNLRGWIFRVGHHLALKQREKAAIRQRREAGLEDAADVPGDPAADPERQLADEQRRRRLQSIVRALPERDRRCLYLRAEGLRYREIAGALQISLGAVAKSLARATGRLIHADEDRGHPRN